jgi:hypothetical protein
MNSSRAGCCRPSRRCSLSLLGAGRRGNAGRGEDRLRVRPPRVHDLPVMFRGSSAPTREKQVGAPSASTRRCPSVGALVRQVGCAHPALACRERRSRRLRVETPPTHRARRRPRRRGLRCGVALDQHRSSSCPLDCPPTLAGLNETWSPPEVPDRGDRPGGHDFAMRYVMQRS